MSEPRKKHKRSLSIKESQLEKIRGELKKLTVNEMRAFINKLGPQTEMYAGIQLLNRILDVNKGKDSEAVRVARVVDFVVKARRILSTGKILEYDFEPDPHDPGDTKYVLEHHDQVKKISPLPLKPRRDFLEIGLKTTGCVALGGYFYLNGLAAEGEKIADPWCKKPDEKEEDAKKKRHIFSLIREIVGEDLGPPFELLLGIIVINEGTDKWNEVKFEQISNVIAEFVQRAERKIEKERQMALG